MTMSTRVSDIKNLLQNWPYRSSDPKLPWAISEIPPILRFTKRERFSTRLLIEMMITSGKMWIFKKVFFMNMRHFHWNSRAVTILHLYPEGYMVRLSLRSTNIHKQHFLLIKNNWNLRRSVLRHMNTSAQNQNSVKRSSSSSTRCTIKQDLNPRKMHVSSARVSSVRFRAKARNE